MARWLFLLPAVLMPASFLGLTLYYLAATPTKDDFFVGPVGVFTAGILLVDVAIGAVGLVGFLRWLWVSPDQRRDICIIAVLSVVATVAAYGLAMRILRIGYQPQT